MATLIISRFKENIEWLEKYEKQFKIIIYNKGKELPKKSTYKIINLPNVGRESHTWLYHIIENYENLDCKNIFLQGQINDLNCMVYKNLNQYSKDLDKDIFSVSRLGLLGPYHWDYNVGIENDKRYSYDWANNKIRKSELGFRKFAKSLFPEIPIFVATSYGGCFGVSKNGIYKNKKSFYSRILDILKDHDNPIEGHYMERLWCYMFTKNKFLNRSIRDVLITKIEKLKWY